MNASRLRACCHLLTQLSFILTLLTGMTALPPAVFAQSPARPTTQTSFEHVAIRSGEISPTTAQSAAEKPPVQTKSLIDLPRLGLALVIVLGLIFVVRALGRRFFPNITASRASGAVRVLSRNTVAHKQQVLLLQVGRRVLVVADNGTQMSPLSEITDPDEVANLVGQATSAAGERFSREFGDAQEGFDRLGGDMDRGAMPGDADEPDADPDAESARAAHGDINGLMEKVRGLAKQLGRS